MIDIFAGKDRAAEQTTTATAATERSANEVPGGPEAQGESPGHGQRSSADPGTGKEPVQPSQPRKPGQEPI